MLVIPVLPPDTWEPQIPRLWSARVAHRGGNSRTGAGMLLLSPGGGAAGRGGGVQETFQNPNEQNRGRRRTKPSVKQRSRQQLVVTRWWQSFWCPAGGSEPSHTSSWRLFGAPGGVWSSQQLPYFRQVRCGVCFFCTSSRQRLRSSSQGSSKFCGVSLGKGRPKATTGR